MKHILPLGTIELPDDWEDRSTYQFVSPPEKGMEAPMAAGRNIQVGSSRTSVLLARAQLPPDKTIEAFLQQQTEELRRALPSLKVNSRDPWQHPILGSIQTVDVSFEVQPGMRVRQLQFYLPTDQETQFTNLTVSCNASLYEARKRDIYAILEAFAPLQPPAAPRTV